MGLRFQLALVSLKLDLSLVGACQAGKLVIVAFYSSLPLSAGNHYNYFNLLPWLWFRKKQWQEMLISLSRVYRTREICRFLIVLTPVGSRHSPNGSSFIGVVPSKKVLKGIIVHRY